MRNLLMVIVLLAACSSSSSSPASSDVTFHGEIDALPDFKGDTGLVPANSPVQVQFTSSIAGKITADARAVGSGSDDAPVMTAVPGSGKLAIDVHFKFAGTLKADVSGLPKYDGPVPGIDDVDIPITAATAFEPFLLGGMANVKAPIPEITLPPIPLGTIPGKLILAVAGGSVLDAELTGVCAAVSKSPSKAHYVAQVTLSGTLVIKPTIEIALPIGPKKTFEIAPVSIAIPKTARALDLGTQSIGHSGTATAGQTGTVGTCDGAMPMAASDAGATADASMDGATSADGDVDSGEDGGACTLGLLYGTASCESCMQASCCAQDNACASSYDCLMLLQCIGGCTDKPCWDACRSERPAAAVLYDTLAGCLDGSCSTDCQ